MHQPGSVRRRLRLAARMTIGDGLVGCSGAWSDEQTGRALAVLDVVQPDGTAQTVSVAAGEVLEIGGTRVRIEAVHPWEPPHAAGVTLTW